ncbi:MAG: type 1 glutamine amidotransferase, partial [Candidatus Nanohaloarchaea archaeon]
MKVAVLDASHGSRAYRNFSKHFEQTERYDVHEEEFPEEPEAVLVTGSSNGVYDEEDWIDILVERLRGYIEDGVPVLGVCFGHQAVAEALGGTVEYMGEYEIGYEKVELDDTSLFQGLDESEEPFSTHQDEVVEMPGSVEKIAESDVSLHGFRHRDKPVFGVQFHPEY